MTELNLAYGYPEEELHKESAPTKKSSKQQQQQMESIPPPQPQIQPQFQQPMQFQQQMQVADMPSYKYKAKTENYSFWDRMVLSRTDVIKLATFSLVILLAISIDKISSYYITKYIADNVLTNVQDFLIRFAYPVAVFLILWIIKSL